MGINIGGSNVVKRYLGSTEITKVYKGTELVYSGMEPFTLTFNIANSPEVLTLPTPTNYLVDWGDGTTSDDNNQHLYTSAGVYTDKMFGVVDDFRFNNGGDKNKLLTVEQPGGFVGAASGFVFRGCVNLTSANLSGVSFPNVGFRYLVDGCSSLAFLDLTGVVNTGAQMQFAFNNTTSLTNVVGLEDLDTSLCQNFDKTFQNSAIKQDVSNWYYSSAVTVASFMSGKTAANYDYQFYDNLLIKWASGAANGGLDFTKLTNLTTNLGSIQYSSAGASARAFLVSEGLIITDGGNNGL